MEFLTDPANANVLMVVSALWVLPWKGFALWKAAHREEKKWFIALLVVNSLALLEILYIFIFSKDKSTQKLDSPAKESAEQVDAQSDNQE